MLTSSISKKITRTGLVMSSIILPVFLYAAGSDGYTGVNLIPCGGPGESMCTFADVMLLINNAMNFALNVLFLPVFAIMIAYAGYLLMTSGDDSKKRGQAKDMFLNVFIGLFITLAAWLIVKAVLVGLRYRVGLDGFTSFFN